MEGCREHGGANSPNRVLRIMSNYSWDRRRDEKGRPQWARVIRVGSMEEATLKLGLKEEMASVRESLPGLGEDGRKDSKAQREAM